jgi:hypothetical protein
MCKPKYMGGLSFRDIELFNLALLARQGWRMLQNPDSLSARVLKARYYPSSDLLHAELGSSPSQVWRAIVEGLKVLKQGLVRRIGTSEHTDPWNDQWIPRDGMLRPIACIKSGAPLRVSEFIELTMAAWKEDKLREFLLPMDVDLILQIPLSGRRQMDFWAWHYDRRWIFSVRSAYKMLVCTREKREAWLDGTASGSNGATIEKQWTSLWRTQVPSKIKKIPWRPAKQSLPTNDVRNHRGMADDDHCNLCGAQDSWRHALTECAMARCVWALVDEEITEHMCELDEGDARKWLAVMIKTLRHDDQVTVFVTMWAIWHAWRRAIHEQIYQGPLSVHHFVENFVANLKEAGDSKRSLPSRTPTPTARPPRWTPPPAGVVKVNVDVAVSKNTGCGSVAAVARNDQGVFLVPQRWFFLAKRRRRLWKQWPAVKPSTSPATLVLRR